ncbi:MAG: DUF4314 domain-containing protein [Oscillospiraceae bacterium]|nr:DUF4314 domain-containing protein [Oscillospiraceae bacterium]
MVKEQYKPGMRVRLLRMNDTQAPPVGTEGTVRGVDGVADDWKTPVYSRINSKTGCPACGYNCFDKQYHITSGTTAVVPYVDAACNHVILLKNKANRAIKARILSWDRPSSGFLLRVAK